MIVPPDETAAALRPILIEGLRLPQQTVELLHQLGIYRIGQLEALRRRELSSRFGPRLLERMDQAAGRLAEPVDAYQPPPEFEAAWSPEYPALRRETVEAALEQLVARVAQKLARCGRGAVRLECRLQCDSAEPVEVSVGLFEPAASAAHLFGLVRLQFERLRLPGPVVAMQVAAAATAPLQRRQRELFTDDAPRRGPDHLAVLIDRLSSRLGHRCVLGVRLLRDAQPELAWRYDPVLDGSRRRRLRSIAPAELVPRPLRLLPRPIALWATSIIPGGPPLRFRFSGREHRIAHTWGPERIETGWWRGNAIGRDYYRVETTAGRRFWLFRRLCDERWFLHGAFE